jgi:hypothetical protein
VLVRNLPKPLGIDVPKLQELKIQTNGERKWKGRGKPNSIQTHELGQEIQRKDCSISLQQGLALCPVILMKVYTNRGTQLSFLDFSQDSRLETKN